MSIFSAANIFEEVRKEERAYGGRASEYSRAIAFSKKVITHLSINGMLSVKLDEALRILSARNAVEKYEKEIEDIKVKSLSHTNSETAKNGYKEEQLICNDLKNPEIKKALTDTINQEFNSCKTVGGTHKTDIQSDNKLLKIQCKKGKKGQFQQLFRTSKSRFIQKFPQINDCTDILAAVFEYPLTPCGKYVDKSIPLKKLDSQHYKETELKHLLESFNNNIEEILKFVLLGEDEDMKPNILIYSEYEYKIRKRIIAFKYTDIFQHLKTLKFHISPRKTGLRLNPKVLSIQRKGGDSGKKGSNQIQFKIIPSILIELGIPYSEHIF